MTLSGKPTIEHVARASETPSAGGVLDDPWFEPYRVPASERAWGIVRDVIAQSQHLETLRGARARKRTPANQQRFEEIVAAVISDLICHHLSGSPGAGLVVSRSKKTKPARSRYAPSFLTEQFPKVLDALASPELAFVSQEIGGRVQQLRMKRTTIKAGPRLIAEIITHRLTAADFAIAATKEEIVLSKRDGAGGKSYFNRSNLRAYHDTATTVRYRGEVSTVNEWLKNAAITFDKEAAKEGVTDPDAIRSIDKVNQDARRLRRYFSRGSFESGGRLYRGFWQTLERKSRLRGLRIEGERVVSLDYAQCNPLIAYSLVGQPAASGDAYTLPGLERYREGIKIVFNAMLFAFTPLTKFPKGLRRSASRTGAPFPAKIKIADVTDAIVKRHPALVDVFHTGAGHRIMFIESEIMMQVLLRLLADGVVALPVFDAIVVKDGDEDKAQEVMLTVFQAQTNLSTTVKPERAH